MKGVRGASRGAFTGDLTLRAEKEMKFEVGAEHGSSRCEGRYLDEIYTCAHVWSHSEAPGNEVNELVHRAEFSRLSSL